MKVVLKVLSFVANGDTSRLIDHPLLHLLAALNANLALVQFRGCRPHYRTTGGSGCPS
ncbi:MAG: hypothetical protein OJF51_002428 [Nitrospira sp.]|nr:MAG: hypothetical protein OJF51_002428 [Nitrospira sp.]